MTNDCPDCKARRIYWARFQETAIQCVGWAIILALTFAIFSCCSGPSVPGALQPSPSRVLMSTLGAMRAERASIRMLYGGSCCDWGGPNPVVTVNRLPVVGDEVVVRWQLSVIPPPPKVTTGSGDVVAPIVAMLASTRPLAAPIASGSAAPGCWLLVMPDMLFLPRIESWLTYDEAKHVVTMRWTPQAGTEGMDLYLQLLVSMPQANPIGIISSSGVHLHVGAQ